MGDQLWIINLNGNYYEAKETTTEYDEERKFQFVNGGRRVTMSQLESEPLKQADPTLWGTGKTQTRQAPEIAENRQNYLFLYIPLGIFLLTLAFEGK